MEEMSDEELDHYYDTGNIWWPQVLQDSAGNGESRLTKSERTLSSNQSAWAQQLWHLQ
jgi:hypothetical protein